MQLMRQMAQADEAQQPIQADAKANSAKQSQSGAPESSCTERPERSDLDPEKLIAFAKRTWGDPLPEWVQAGLRRLGVSVDDGQALPDGLSPLSIPQTQTSGGSKGVALSLASL
jgi:hypothetical protein